MEDLQAFLTVGRMAISPEWAGAVIAALTALISLVFLILSFRQSQKALAKAREAILLEERSLRSERLRRIIDAIQRVEDRIDHDIDQLSKIVDPNEYASSGLMYTHFARKFDILKGDIRIVVFQNRLFLDDEFWHEIYTRIDLWRVPEDDFSISGGDCRAVALEFAKIFGDLLELAKAVEIEFSLGVRSIKVLRAGISAAAPGARAVEWAEPVP